MRLKQVVSLLRPTHYIKNCFIFIPVFFGGVVGNFTILQHVALGFAAFCFAASGVYVFNDILDAADDRNHPTKCNRPIASGAIPIKTAVKICICIWGLALLLAWMLGFPAYLFIVGYVVLNVFYTVKFKKIAVLDVCCIAIGFVLRVYLGAYLAGVTVSHWLILMTFLLSMLLALGKRYDDVSIQQKSGNIVRKSLQGYNQAFLLQAMQLMAAINIVCYLMYTTSEQVMIHYSSKFTFLTSAWVILGVMRYFQQVLIFSNSASPTRLIYTDKFLQLIILGWLTHFMFLIYL
ncbi:UbiA prenyltransferase family protein [Halodesulfovibrio marinisediminis]|uniref:UbiA prenyltransferase family protein n=1 Tax=Halodesulfovibrio marinisediminis DSM 17456 TaxID=1121457 RepID=A0A1N6EB44_9BACT|nr:UbiA prenyltransferase family protein [Halodesulfovibrio marinisediminis]SIN80250.1 UbiA prenyltransferase family protein [Halodesulfovibrio marinisediminis DSM 17456]